MYTLSLIGCKVCKLYTMHWTKVTSLMKQMSTDGDDIVSFEEQLSRR